MPSQTARIAPSVQPSNACGPPIAASISGMVMNGPTPTTFDMLSAVARSTPKPRVNSGGAGDFGLSVNGAEWHGGGNLATAPDYRGDAASRLGPRPCRKKFPVHARQAVHDLV